MIINGESKTVLSAMKSESVDCIMTKRRKDFCSQVINTIYTDIRNVNNLKRKITNPRRLLTSRLLTLHWGGGYYNG